MLAGKPLVRYSTRIGRAYLTRNQQPTQSQWPLPNGYHHAWTRVFHRSIPPKWQSILWQFHSGGMITGMDLRRMQIPANTFCSRCQYPMETVMHRYLECPEVVKFWNWAVSFMLSQLVETNITDVPSFLDRFKQSLGADLAVIATAAGVWAVYRAQVAWHFRQEATTTPGLINEWKKLVRETLITRRCTAIERHTVEQYDRKWRRWIDLFNRPVIFV